MKIYLNLLLGLSFAMCAQDGKLDPSFNPTAQPPLVPGEAIYRFGVLPPFGITTIATSVVNHYVDGESGTKRIVLGGSWQGPRVIQIALLIIDDIGNIVAKNQDLLLGGDADEIYAMAVQPDNKVIVVGSTLTFGLISDQFRWFVARFNTDAQLDTTFNANGTIPGVAFVDFTPVAAPGSLFCNAEPAAVALTREGKIVVAGKAQYEGGLNTNPYYFAVSVLNPDGTLDSSFAAGAGRKIYGPNVFAENVSSDAFALAIQSKGSNDNIIFAGQGETDLNHMQLVRVLPNGDLDLTFGVNGIDQIVFNPENNENATGVDIYPDGKIMAVGNDGSTALIAKRLADGGPDANFGVDGKATFRPDEIPVSCAALNIQNNDNILMAGVYSTPVPQFMTWRFTAAGNLDTTFNPPLGYVLQSFAIDPEEQPSVEMGSLALQEDGKVVVVGTANPLPIFDESEGVERFITRSKQKSSAMVVLRYLNDNSNAADPQVLQAPLFTSPANSYSNCNANPPTLAGIAQNPANITLYANGCEIGRTITQGAENAWSLTPAAPLNVGSNTFKVVAEYKSGNMNAAATTCCGIGLGPQSCLSAAIRQKYCSTCPSVIDEVCAFLS